MRAAVGLYGEPEEADHDPSVKKKIEEAVASSLGGRLKLFAEIYSAQGLDAEWLDDFKTKIAEGIPARNRFAHGLWSEEQNGHLKCRFFERWSEDDFASEKVWMGTPDALHHIAEANMDNARLLAEHFNSTRLHAAE